MHTIKIDFKNGLVSLDSKPIVVDEKGMLAGAIAKLCSPPTATEEGHTRYDLSGKASVSGKSADVVIEMGEGRVCSVRLLFDLIEFFTSSILESRILKACEKSAHVKFISPHRSKAFLEDCEWGQAEFSYDPKQGDLSLEIIYERGSDEASVDA